MGFDIKDYVKRANDVKSYQKLNKLVDGRYTMAVRDIFFREDKEKTALYFIVGVQILAAASVKVLGVDSVPNSVGEFINIYSDLKAPFDGGSKDMIKFARALHNLSEGQLSADQMNELIREMANGTDKDNVMPGIQVQPCRGMLIANTTNNRVGELYKQGKNAGKPRESFAQSNWINVAQGNSKEEIAARRAKLGGDSLPG